MTHSLPNHHPDDDFLLGLAAATLPAGMAAVVASHVETCPVCQQRLVELEALGGVLFEGLAGAELRADAWAQTLAALDAGPTSATRHAAVSARSATVAPTDHPPLPDGVRWPQSLVGAQATPWRWLGPGMRWSRVHLPWDPQANVFLLRIGAGKFLPPHSHSRLEVTQVLWGSFHDGRELFGAGDFDAADGDVHHQPVVQPQGECICLAAVDGRVVFDGLIARLLGSLVGM